MPWLADPGVYVNLGTSAAPAAAFNASEWGVQRGRHNNLSEREWAITDVQWMAVGREQTAFVKALSCIAHWTTECPIPWSRGILHKGWRDIVQYTRSRQPHPTPEAQPTHPIPADPPHPNRHTTSPPKYPIPVDKPNPNRIDNTSPRRTHRNPADRPPPKYRLGRLESDASVGLKACRFRVRLGCSVSIRWRKGTSVGIG